MNHRRLHRITAGAVAIALLLIFTSPPMAFAMESRSTADLAGIDVSHWDGAIQWHQIANEHVRFAYIKATGGSSFVDPRFAANVREAQQNGIAVGAYHYAKLTSPFQSSEPVLQATFFVHTMKSAMSNYGDVMPVLDVEQSGNLSNAKLVQWIQTFADTVQRETHRQVMLYTSEDFLEKHAGLDGAMSHLPLWVAYYDRYYHGHIPPNIGGWNHWVVWQYSDRGEVRGISQQVDLDAGPTSLDALKGDIAPTPAKAKVPPNVEPATTNQKPQPKNTVAAQSISKQSWLRSGILLGTSAVIVLFAGLAILIVLRRRKHQQSKTI